MRIPFLIYVAAASDGLPLVAAVAVRRPWRGASAWILAWCAAMVVFNILSLCLALRHQHNLWISHVFAPLSAALVLWALSCWQHGEVARLTLRLLIVGVVAIWALLTVTIESTSTFSRAAEPMAYLVCLGAASYTIIVRSLRSHNDLVRQDWLWVTAGLALYFGTWCSIIPLSALLVGPAPEMLARVYEVQAALSTIAMLAIMRGMMCPTVT